MTAMNTAVARRAALATALLSALAAVGADAKSKYKPKFTWWAILIMMIGIVVVIVIALVVYFCVFYKGPAGEKKEVESEPDDAHSDDAHSNDARSEGSAAVQPANNEAETHEPTQKPKDYPTE